MSAVRPAAVGIVMLATAPASADELEWAIDGYYRTRASYIRNLANQPDDPDGFRGEAERLRDTSFLLHRVRLEPRLTYGKLAKLQLTVDALDDVVWGDNDAKSVAPLFAAEPTTTDRQGETVSSIEVKRAWMEIDVKVGQLRVGRMPSHWGLGLLANGGGTSGCPGPAVDPRQPGGCLDPFFDDDYGDNHFGTVHDRILFATRPFVVVDRLRGRSGDGALSKLIVAYAYDKLVEDYLNVALEQQLVAETQSDIEGGATPSGPITQRGLGESAFLSRPEDDVQQHVVVLLYDDPEFDRLGKQDELRAGVYVVLRTQPRSRIVCATEDPLANEPICEEGPSDLAFVGDGSSIQVYDAWYRLRLGPFYGETELYAIRGETDGGVPVGPDSRLDKTARMYGLASRWGYVTEKLDGIFEVGHASGDTDLADDVFTQRPLHPDYNVGLLLYEEVVRELTARTIGRLRGLDGYLFNSRSLQSNGGVINSWYVFPRVRGRPLDGLELIGGLVAAWWDETGFLPPERLPDTTRDPARFLGWEINGASRIWWAENHLSFSLEAAYLRFGQGLRDAYRFVGAPALLGGVRGAATVQGRLAFVF